MNPQPKPVSPRRDQDYMAWIRTQRCVVSLRGVLPVGCDMGPWLRAMGNANRWPIKPCEGRIEASHTGERGIGQKADDWTCLPKCHGHHVDWETHVGAFKGWPKEARRLWAAAWVAHFVALYAREAA